MRGKEYQVEFVPWNYNPFWKRTNNFYFLYSFIVNLLSYTWYLDWNEQVQVTENAFYDS